MSEKKPNITPKMLSDAMAHELYHSKITLGDEATKDTSEEFRRQKAAELEDLAHQYKVPRTKDEVKQEEMGNIKKILNRMKELDEEGVKPTLQEGQGLQLNTNPKE